MKTIHLFQSALVMILSGLLVFSTSPTHAADVAKKEEKPQTDSPAQTNNVTDDRAADVQSSADKIEAQIAQNPDQVPVQVSARKPNDVRVTNLPVPGYPQGDSAKLKKYSELKGCIAIAGQLTLSPKWGALKPPYLCGLSKVPDECRDLLSNGHYKHAGWAWSDGTDVVLGDDGTIHTAEKGTLTFVWFVPNGTTNVDMVFPGHKPVTIELRPSSAQDARKFGGYYATGLIDSVTRPRVTGLAFDTTRKSFEHVPRADFSSERLLAKLAKDAKEIRDTLGTAKVAAGAGVFDTVEKGSAKGGLCIVFFPRSAITVSFLGKKITLKPYSPGSLTTLKQVQDEFGKQTEKEQYTGPMWSEGGSEGLVYWWNDVGVAVSKDGELTHLLLRTAP